MWPDASYDTIDLNPMHLAVHMLIAKQDVSKSQNPLTCPDISDREFLKVDLRDGNSDLHPLEIAASDFIKETANTDMNIQEADKRGRDTYWETPDTEMWRIRVGLCRSALTVDFPLL